MPAPDSTRTAHSGNSLTAPDRREFLGSFLTALLFWRHRGRRLAGIDVERIHHGRARRRYLLIHGNEQTARQVLTLHLVQAHGSAVLVRNRTRNVPFQGGELDPNRMFSREGAERNLRSLNPGWSDAEVLSGLVILDRDRHQFLNAVWPAKGDALIAVHNNSGGYSVRDETEVSNRVALKDETNPHEFCLCTDPADFDLLAKGPYNVVLQNRARGADDGSLSRYAARAGFRYVNIEAGLGKLEKQRAMLDWVDGALPRSGE